MNLIGRALTVALKPLAKYISPVSSEGRGWRPFVGDWYTGAWQRNDELSIESVLAYPAVFACITQIANDIGKLGTKLMEIDEDGIWSETTSPSFSPVLRRPNRYQNQIQLKEWWITSKLERGNAYALKGRDQRGLVTELYLLDPNKVEVLVSEDGSVFYDLSQDNLSGLPTEKVRVPASEIIHDRMNCLFHPLIGISPLFAAGASGSLGLSMQTDAITFFGNGATPGGVLEAPGSISDETAKRLKEHWDANYTGKNRGKVAVLGDGLKYTPMRMSSVDAQQVERSKRLDEHVCAAFHIPPYVVGLGDLPGGMKPGDLKQVYYDNCLHSLIEQMEACLDAGLALPEKYRVELDIDSLLRMDQATQITTLSAAVGGSLMTPNEARRRMGLPPLAGGDTVYLQQQYFSLQALSERDQNDPFATPAPAPASAIAAPEPEEEEDQTERALALLRTKQLVEA